MIAARCLTGILGAAALAWSFFVVPIFWHQSPAEGIAKYIIAEVTFKIEALGAFETAIDDVRRRERPSILNSVSIIKLRLLERAMARNDRANIDGLMGQTEETIRQSLANSPADPFLWTVLFWLENTKNGFSREHLEYLRMAYLTGPNEGWIAVKRNRFALAVSSALTPDLVEDAVREFSRLVGSSFYNESADILAGPGWQLRDALMAGLKNLDRGRLQTFDNLIYHRGLNVSVPGITRPEWRPWH